MDECEALCDRLTIMVDGQLKCLGKVQHLKSKYGKGYTVFIKLRQSTSFTIEPEKKSSFINKIRKSSDSSSNETISFETAVEELKSNIERNFEGTLKDEHRGMLMYHIIDKRASIGTLFQFLQKFKKPKSLVEDFTVCDATLEQIFLSFASEKLAAEDKKKIKSTENKV